MLARQRTEAYTCAIMTSNETGPQPDNKKIADESYRQHRDNIDVELARRGLLATRGGIGYVPHEQLLDYVRDLEERLKKAESNQPPDAQ